MKTLGNIIIIISVIVAIGSFIYGVIHAINFYSIEYSTLEEYDKVKDNLDFHLVEIFRALSLCIIGGLFYQLGVELKKPKNKIV